MIEGAGSRAAGRAGGKAVPKEMRVWLDCSWAKDRFCDITSSRESKALMKGGRKEWEEQYIDSKAKGERRRERGEMKKTERAVMATDSENKSSKFSTTFRPISNFHPDFQDPLIKFPIFDVSPSSTAISIQPSSLQSLASSFPLPFPHLFSYIQRCSFSSSPCCCCSPPLPRSPYPPKPLFFLSLSLPRMANPMKYKIIRQMTPSAPVALASLPQ